MRQCLVEEVGEAAAEEIVEHRPQLLDVLVLAYSHGSYHIESDDTVFTYEDQTKVIKVNVRQVPAHFKFVDGQYGHTMYDRDHLRCRQETRLSFKPRRGESGYRGPLSKKGNCKPHLASGLSNDRPVAPRSRRCFNGRRGLEGRRRLCTDLHVQMVRSTRDSGSSICRKWKGKGK